MATTYIERDVNSDLAPSWPNTTAFDKNMDANTAASGGIVVSLTGTQTKSASFITIVAKPNSDDTAGWPNGGTQTVRIAFTVTNMQINLKVRCVRLSSTGTILDSGAFTAVQNCNANRTFSPVSPTWGALACGDRFAIELDFTNTQSMTQSCTVDSNLVTTDVATDLTEDSGTCSGGPTLLELSDAINIGDSIVNNPVMVHSDAVGVADVLNQTPDTRQSDAVTVADTLMLTAIQALQDAINIGDTLQPFGVVQQITDAVNVGDSLVFTVIMPPLSDGVTIGDVVTNLPLFVKNLSDAVTVGDTLQPFNVVQRLTDAVDIGDAITVNVIMSPLSDAVTVTDDLNQTVIQKLQDTINVTDSAPVLKVIQQLIDAINVTDSLVINVVAVLNDPVNVGDVNTFTVIVKFGDSITISDNVTNNELGQIASLGVMIKGRTPIITIRGKIDS